MQKLEKMHKLLYLLAFAAFFACKGEADVADQKAAKTAKTATKTTAKTPPPAQTNNQRRNLQQQRTPPLPSGPYKAKNEGWMVNLEEAYNESKKTGKPIMANFTGSDWCGWCKRLDKSVFHQPGFDKWADENVVLLELDFPKRFRVPPEIAQQNNSLKQQFGVRGFPTIWLFDVDKNASGQWDLKALGKTGYTKTLAEFQQTIGGYMAKRG